MNDDTDKVKGSSDELIIRENDFNYSWCTWCDKATVDFTNLKDESVNTCCAAFWDEGDEIAEYVLEWKRKYPPPARPTESMVVKMCHDRIHAYKNMNPMEILILNIFASDITGKHFLNQLKDWKFLARHAESYGINFMAESEVIKIWIADLVRAGITTEYIKFDLIEKEYGEDLRYIIR